MACSTVSPSILPISAVFACPSWNIDMVDVAARSSAEKQREIGAESLAKDIFHVLRIVGRVFGAAHSVEVHREGNDRRGRCVRARLVEQNDSSPAVDRSGGENDVRILLARVELHRAVFHVETAIECEPTFNRGARFQFERLQSGLCIHHGRYDLFDERDTILGRVVWVAAEFLCICAD